MNSYCVLACCLSVWVQLLGYRLLLPLLLYKHGEVYSSDLLATGIAQWLER